MTRLGDCMGVEEREESGLLLRFLGSFANVQRGTKRFGGGWLELGRS